MQKKYLKKWILAGCLCFGLTLTACGKDNQVTGLMDDMVSDITDEVDDGGILNADADWSAELGEEHGEGSFSADGSMIDYDTPSSDMSGGVLGDTSEDGTALDGTGQDDMGVIPETTDQNPATELPGGFDVQEDTNNDNSTDVSTYVSENSNDNIYIANMSGKDLTALTFTFTAGSIQNQNILGESKLNDGKMFVFTVSDMITLRNAKNLKLSATGTLRNGDEIDFGTISVVDPAGMTLVLSSDNGEYGMFID